MLIQTLILIIMNMLENIDESELDKMEKLLNKVFT